MSIVESGIMACLKFGLFPIVIIIVETWHSY